MILALIYKDVMVLLKNGKTILLFMLVFLVAAAVKPATPAFLIYPVVALSTMTTNTLSYDETYRWEQYADALPYGRRRIVTAKFLLSLLCLGVTAALFLLTMGAASLISGTAQWDNLLWSLELLVVLTTIYTVLILPVALRFGLQKSRVVLLLVVGATVAVVVGASYVLPDAPLPLPETSVGIGPIFLGTLAVCAVLWVISWFISIRVYQTRVL